MKAFVARGSVVRKIWGKSDTILLIFAGSAAEFALNKAVDWLYYTGKLPADPIGRLFSTVGYARKIVLSEEHLALQTIDRMSRIHDALEEDRKKAIPQWAYRDVLYMLIDYSIRSFEVLERPLTLIEKQEIFEVFYRVGTGMKIRDLPVNYSEFILSRKTHLRQDLAYSDYTRDLFNQYRIHLGTPRFRILKEAQKLVLPAEVRSLLGYNALSLLKPTVPFYRLFKNTRMEWAVKNLILPKKYVKEIRDLDLTKDQL